jgi:uncharacterized protein (TIGR02217 family)
MASFHEVRFPEGISYGASGGPGFKTTVMSLSSGYEKRNIEWSRARAQYDVSQGVKTQDQLNELLGFFYARKGKAYGFRFKDWSDFTVPFDGDPAQVIGVTNGNTNTYQTIKVYGDEADSYTRIINKVVEGTFQLYVDGVPHNSTIDETTGLIVIDNTLKNTTGKTLSITCEFDVPVRFDVDDMKVSIDDYNSFTWGSIPLVEVRDLT